MRTIVTVFRKEFVDTIRDRRTIMFMVVIPLLLFPLLFHIMMAVQKNQAHKASAKTLHVACLDAAPRFLEMLRGHKDIVVVPNVAPGDVSSLVKADSLDGAFVFSSGFVSDVADMKPARVDFYYKAADDSPIIRDRLRDVVDAYEKELLDQRFQHLALDESIMHAIDVDSHNVATMQEQVGKSAGGFLPYMFILFCFLGAMYPAIDLGAGEKERGTMETLLTAPVNRFHILLGKFGVVVASGLLSAMVSIVGLYIAIKQASDIPPEVIHVIMKILGWKTIVMVLSLLIPLTIFFAGILLSVSLTARGFKEAQSMISPLNFVVIIPAAIGLVPGITMNYGTALIPILNVSLATKEIIAGTMKPGYLAVVYVSLISLALLSLWGAAQWFRRESTIFRS
jgi:sodium transport system permease protein